MNDAEEPAKTDRLFRFKNFSLTDSGCAMKIGTDGVLLGATVANLAEIRKPQHLLDIGTGCGLIALMAAQKCSAQIHAIDIDADACTVARQNFLNSPWSDRLEAFHSSLQDFVSPSGRKYDIIVSNPPYFQNSLPSLQKARALARHNHSLTFDELFRFSSALLAPSGILSVIYPADIELEVNNHAKNYSLFEQEKIFVQATDSHPPKRIITNLSFGMENNPISRILSIETNERHSFTDAYRELTCDFHPFF